MKNKIAAINDSKKTKTKSKGISKRIKALENKQETISKELNDIKKFIQSVEIWD